MQVMKTKLWVQLESSCNADIKVRWCFSDHKDHELFEASLEEFTIWLQAQQSEKNALLSAVLLLSGEQVMSRSVAFSAQEKKHLQKLLPFMLESHLAVDLSYVHVAHLIAQGTQKVHSKAKHGMPSAIPSAGPFALVAYTDRKQLQWRINALESLAVEVEDIASIPTLLPATDTHWSVLLDRDVCHLHAGSVMSTSIELDMLPGLIDAAIVESVAGSVTGLAAIPSTITVFVVAAQHSCAQQRALMKILNEHSVLQSAGISVRQETVSNHWACLHFAHKQRVNLRQGEFAAPLRLAKYWQQWRVPAIAAMVTVTAVLTMAIVETQINQYRFSALESRIEQRYRELMPDGVLVDAVQQLSTQVSLRRSAQSTQSLTGMLAAMLEPFASADGLNLHRLSFTANTRTETAGSAAEIQMNISAPSTDNILQLSQHLNSAGWNTQAQNITRSGDRQQASLVVRGNAMVTGGGI
jgi:type II secretion system protein L